MKLKRKRFCNRMKLRPAIIDSLLAVRCSQGKHSRAAIAEHEAEVISQRTIDALQAAKRRGVVLGRNGAERLAPKNRAAAMDRACLLKPILADLTGAGMSIRQIAAELTARGIPTARGGNWHPQTVSRVLERVARNQS